MRIADNSIATLASRSTSSDSANVWTRATATINAQLSTDAVVMDMAFTENSGTATLSPACELSYRLIG